MSGKFIKSLCCTTLLAGIGFGGQAAAAPVSQAVEASRPVAFTVMLPLRNHDELEALLAAQQDPKSASYHQWLTPASFGLRFGPSAASFNHVASVLRAQGFNITGTHTRSLSVSGSAALVERAFGTSLRNVQGRSGKFHVAATTALSVPNELASEKIGLVGLSGIERHVMSRSTGPVPDNRFSATGNYYYTDLKQAYVYPSHAATVKVGGTATPFDGTGATIGTVISSDVLDTDVKAIFDHEHFSTTTGQPDPTLFARRLVNGGAPFSSSSDASFEASLDVQAEIAGAPGAHVVLYNMPSLADSDIIDAYTAVVDDNLVDAVSSSFGECESFYLPKYNSGMDLTATLFYEHELYEQGNAQGITFLASSGDQAGKECITTSYFHGKPGKYIAGASTPATDPNVVAVGGTNVVTAYDPPTLDSTYAGENAWSDPEADSDPYGFGATVTGEVWGAGGGASVFFAAPAYQSLVTTGSTMRMTPDVGMQVGGCPGDSTDYHPNQGGCNGGNKTYNGSGNTQRSDYTIYFGGSRVGVIGTSVASPEFTSVVALLVEKKGRQGNLNAYIYKKAAQQAAGGARSFHTLIPGFNGVQQSVINSTYDISTGVGTPIVTTFLGSPNIAPAGLPQTISNP